MWSMACSLLPVLSMRWLRPSGKPAVTKVTIYQVTKRPWGELVTDARVDGREYVAQQVAPIRWNGSHLGKGAPITFCGKLNKVLGCICIEYLGARLDRATPGHRRGVGVCTGPNSQFYKRKNPNRKPA